jgi:hypothetical protein
MSFWDDLGNDVTGYVTFGGCNDSGCGAGHYSGLSARIAGATGSGGSSSNPATAIIQQIIQTVIGPLLIPLGFILAGMFFFIIMGDII